MFKHQDLKTRQRAIRGAFQASLSLRTHRALSWLRRAEMEAADDDARFLFLWISFNAAYANEIHDRRALTERKLLIRFLGRLVGLDQEELLHQIVWEQFSSSIRLLLHNPYVFQPFWDYQRGKIQEEPI